RPNRLVTSPAVAQRIKTGSVAAYESGARSNSSSEVSPNAVARSPCFRGNWEAIPNSIDALRKRGTRLVSTQRCWFLAPLALGDPVVQLGDTVVQFAYEPH
ncbi:MAG: hypothetical protein ACI9K5_002315, partial [Gammaproteobacteria bacterium]